MPRRPRVFIEGGIYHVYNRFARGAEIFLGAEEAERFLDLLKHVARRDGLTVFAWVLMSNHYHVAFRSGPVPLSRTIGYVQARFSQGFNRRNRSTGPLWQSRYKAKLVEDQSYLEQLIAYIHLNPVSAGIVDDPSGYPLSGHRELLRKLPSSLVAVEETLAIFGGTTRTARRRYVRQLEGAREVDWKTELPGVLPWWGREPDRAVEPETPEAWIDERGVSTGLDRPQVTADVYLGHVAQALRVSVREVTARNSGHKITRIRTLIVSLAVERWRLRAKDLAPYFGRRNDVVSRWVRWGAQRRLEDEEFAKLYEGIDRNLSREFGDTYWLRDEQA